MWFIVLSMVAVVLLATAVILYVAYPHRGEALPLAPEVGTRVRRAIRSLPTVVDGDLEHAGRR